METWWIYVTSRLAKFNRAVERTADSNTGAVRKFLYLLDFALAFLWHGASISDYFDYEFHKKRSCERRQFVTVRRARAIYRFLNDSRVGDDLRDKSRFHHAFCDLTGREYCEPSACTAQEFAAFAGRHRSFVAKPVKGTWGAGVTRVDITGDADLPILHARLARDGMIVEELLKQTPPMAAFHPDSVNTVRVTTVLLDRGPRVMTAALRMGNGHALADNLHAGGLAAAIEAETGTVVSEAVDRHGCRYVRHPMTDQQIVGFVVPCWEEVIALVKLAASRLPRTRYVGWDVAISDRCRPVLIEGNDLAAFDIQQQADQIGKRPLYNEVLNSMSRLP